LFYFKFLKNKDPNFEGSSYLCFTGLAEALLIWLEINLVFRTTSKEGLHLYNGNRNDGHGDFMAIFLNQGFDLGNGITTAMYKNMFGTEMLITLTMHALLYPVGMNNANHSLIDIYV
jgi:hypothetical protein